MTKSEVKEWLFKQAIWQIYLPGPKYIPMPTTGSKELAVGDIHQADLLFLPHDTIDGVTYTYTLTVVDVASRYKEAEALSTKYTTEVTKAFEKNYDRGPLQYPTLVDAGKEFLGDVAKLMKKHNTEIRVGEPGNHRAQGIVERFNMTLAEHFVSTSVRARNDRGSGGSEGRSSEWVSQLPAVIKSLNNTATRLIGKKPIDAVKIVKPISPSPASPAERAVGLDEKRLVSHVQVRYLYKSN